MSKIINPREAAFLSLVFSSKKKFIEDFFAEDIELSKKDLKLTKEIAYGTKRRLLSLKYLSKRLGNLKLKLKENLLLYTAIYQYFFMDRIPIYAIVNETTNLAKKYFGKKKASFFNAILRKLEKKKLFLFLPKPRTLDDLCFYYSYPKYFIKEVISEYGKEKAKEILEAQNHVFPPMVRIRHFEKKEKAIEVIHDKKFMVGIIKGKDFLSSISLSNRYYIQNITPVLLIEELSKAIGYPKKILDLCASPGGKIIALFDLYPKAL